VEENLQQNSEDQTVFSIQRIYVKNQSFEAPHALEIFQKPWEPELSIQIQSSHTKLADDNYEVILQLTVTVNSAQTVAFVAEVHQAGIFKMQNFSDVDVHRLVGQICPNILYPYVRTVISEMVSHASFPGLYLAPINFESLYEQQLLEQKKAAQVPHAEA
jgi:preprotein translocase subunit SecB